MISGADLPDECCMLFYEGYLMFYKVWVMKHRLKSRTGFWQTGG